VNYINYHIPNQVWDYDILQYSNLMKRFGWNVFHHGKNRSPIESSLVESIYVNETDLIAMIVYKDPKFNTIFFNANVNFF